MPQRAAARPAVSFFISYTGSDVKWARWIGQELTAAGYTCRLQAEDFPPGSRFINEMRRALDEAGHVLAVLSPAYFRSDYAALEVQSAIATDPLGRSRRVIPVRIAECAIPEIFRDLVYIDFVGKSQHEQRRALRAGVRAAVLGDARERGRLSPEPWPGDSRNRAPVVATGTGGADASPDLPLRVQFLACETGRGLDLKGQFRKIKTAIARSHNARRISLTGDFDVTEVNLFSKLNAQRPHVVHISGNQNGGDVILRADGGGETLVSDEALAGLLSSLGNRVRLVIIDTCRSYRCAKRVAEVVDCALGVDDDIYDEEAIRFYEAFYGALGAGMSVKDAHGQALAALRFNHVPLKRIPKLCAKQGINPRSVYLLGRS